jgi:hypothetical protein
VSWERWRNVTVVCDERKWLFTPPMFICPRQRLSNSMKRHGPAGSSYQCSKTGWINEELFLLCLQHFSRQTLFYIFFISNLYTLRNKNNSIFLCFCK